MCGLSRFSSPSRQGFYRGLNDWGRVRNHNCSGKGALSLFITVLKCGPEHILKEKEGNQILIIRKQSCPEKNVGRHVSYVGETHNEVVLG